MIYIYIYIYGEFEEGSIQKDYPIAILAHKYQINFMLGYDKLESAIAKWKSRSKRINKNKLYLILV